MSISIPIGGGGASPVQNADGTITIGSVTFPGDNVHIASVAPTVTDDSANGFEQGSLWYDDAANQLYVLTDDSAGAAGWETYPLSSGSAAKVLFGKCWANGTTHSSWGVSVSGTSICNSETGVHHGIANGGIVQSYVVVGDDVFATIGFSSDFELRHISLSNTSTGWQNVTGLNFGPFVGQGMILVNGNLAVSRDKFNGHVIDEYSFVGGSLTYVGTKTFGTVSGFFQRYNYKGGFIYNNNSEKWDWATESLSSQSGSPLAISAIWNLDGDLYTTDRDINSSTGFDGHSVLIPFNPQF